MFQIFYMSKARESKHVHTGFPPCNISLCFTKNRLTWPIIWLTSLKMQWTQPLTLALMVSILLLKNLTLKNPGFGRCFFGEMKFVYNSSLSNLLTLLWQHTHQNSSFLVNVLMDFQQFQLVHLQVIMKPSQDDATTLKIQK